MTERAFDDGFWTNPFVAPLPQEGKTLYGYSFTNSHCNQAGLYKISPITISNETGISQDKLLELFNLLEEKVKWYPDANLVWVKNFIKRQAKSPYYLQAVAKSLITIHNNGAVKELLEYNLSVHNLLIPYEQYVNKILGGSRDSKNTDITPFTTATDIYTELICTEILLIMCETLKELKGWQFDEDDDARWLNGLKSDYPTFEEADLKACIDYHSGRVAPKQKGVWKNRFRNWMMKKVEFAKKADDAKQVGEVFSGKNKRDTKAGESSVTRRLKESAQRLGYG